MRFLLLLGTALFACAAYADSKPDEPVHVGVDWRIAIDAQGHVTRMTAKENELVDRVPEIRTRLEQEIHGWSFVPGTVDGKPAPTETGLHVKAELLATSDNTVSIRIDHASVGGSWTQMAPPHYPTAAIREHKTGEVVLRIAYDANGKVTSAVLDPDAPKVSDYLVEASIKAAETWTFQPELVGGHSLAGVVRSPFCYSLNMVGHRLQDKCDWEPPGSHQALDQGETLALNPVAHLSTDVAGLVL